MTSRIQLRQRLRIQRRNLDSGEQQRCAGRLAGLLSGSRLISRSQRIAAYLPADGEMDPTPLLHQLFLLGKSVYLPVISNFSAGRLDFAEYKPGDRLVYNRYGIPEPELTSRRLIKPLALDLILTPLVAFDNQGHRIGMGGGFYDQTFAFLNHRRYWQKPRLMGLAYEFQRVAAIQTESWDVSLDFAVTEKKIYLFDCNH